MTDTAIANSGFQKIQNTLQDSKIFEGLVSAGILPPGFQVLKLHVNITGAAGNYPVLDHVGKQVVLSAGRQVIYMSGGVVTTLVGGTSAQVGLAATAAGASATALSGVLTLALVNSDGAGLHVNATAPNGGGAVVVGVSNHFMTVTTLGTFSAGELQIVLILV